MPNRLADERSPYLLQHAQNPVDWYPWGDEAFARARAEQKPIFLSVGYSTCHWCHVMEHESFESHAIADVLNREFISIKVDREERPDVDRVYMSFVQATTGAGGWPMSVWLTPELKPFYGGTYFPPDSRWGRPGFVEVLREIARVWNVERSKILASADEVLQQLSASQTGPRHSAREPGDVADERSLRDGVEEFARTFDARHGGFAGAPKFPRPSELLFLLREHARTGDTRAKEMALKTLSAMATGGMRDHVGGGFHRYSVDAEWRVPHFEKMLYDQAQLVLAFIEAAQLTSDAFYAVVAEDTLQYVQRELTDPGGGFYSAEDADSVPPELAGDAKPHKSEGAFYIWSETEIRIVLAGGADADIARFRFGIEPAGNAPQDPHGEFIGKNILFVARSVEDVATLSGRTPEEVVEVLGRARRVLFEVRAKRPRPHLDDKILTAWNGLMIAACARAARVLGHPDVWGTETADRAAGYLASAQRAAAFVRETLWNRDTGTLLRRYRDGEAAIDAYCEDYAALVWGALELFQADGDPAWLAWAIDLAARQDELFWDAQEGGWFSTSGRDPSVLLRLKEEHDGAEPSAGSVATMNLLTLAHLTGDDSAHDKHDKHDKHEKHEKHAKIARAFHRMGPALGRSARAMPLMASALSTYHAGIAQIVIVGPPDDERTRELSAEVARAYRPFAIVVPVDPGRAQTDLARVAPFIGSMTALDSQPTAYVCRDFACREPVHDVEGLRRVLKPEAP